MINGKTTDENLIPWKVTKLPYFPAPPVPVIKEVSVLIPSIVQAQTAQFASALAHEVRNPLSNIGLAAQMLQSMGSTAQQKVYLDIIMRATGNINDMVTNLLNSGQPDTSLLKEYNIHELLDEVILMSKDRIMLKNITVKKYYTTIDCKVMVNKQKLKIALTNIIINAIEAMPAKGGELKLLTKSINDTCVLEISDNGIGISKQHLEQIFKPYFTNKPGGLGLGLSTTLDMLLLNHAKLIVKSKEGKGTSFIISFEKSLEIIEL